MHGTVHVCTHMYCQCTNMYLNCSLLLRLLSWQSSKCSNYATRLVYQVLYVHAHPVACPETQVSSVNLFKNLLYGKIPVNHSTFTKMPTLKLLFHRCHVCSHSTYCTCSTPTSTTNTFHQCIQLCINV